jgi:hypothetical protein
MSQKRNADEVVYLNVRTPEYKTVETYIDF